MSFDQSQMSYGHVVTYPSVWLPPSNTSKIMLLSYSQAQAHDLLACLQERYSTINWAFYLAPDSSYCDMETLDWLWINQYHMHVIVGKCDQAGILSLWMSMPHKNKFLLQGSHTASNTLAELAGYKLWTNDLHMWDYIVDNDYHHSSNGQLP